MRRLDLVHDCERCDALCCIATSFEASEDFAIDKEAGVACPHLTPDHRCAIHDHLEARGFRGCAAYGCHGAGQRVTGAFAGRDDAAAERNEAFMILRGVHELLWLLQGAAELCPPSHAELRGQTARAIDVLQSIGTDAHRRPRGRSPRPP
jgi:hypothetical protein